MFNQASSESCTWPTCESGSCCHLVVILLLKLMCCHSSGVDLCWPGIFLIQTKSKVCATKSKMVLYKVRYDLTYRMSRREKPVLTHLILPAALSCRKMIVGSRAESIHNTTPNIQRVSQVSDSIQASLFCLSKIWPRPMSTDAYGSLAISPSCTHHFVVISHVFDHRAMDLSFSSSFVMQVLEAGAVIALGVLVSAGRRPNIQLMLNL